MTGQWLAINPTIAPNGILFGEDGHSPHSVEHGPPPFVLGPRCRNASQIWIAQIAEQLRQNDEEHHAGIDDVPGMVGGWWAADVRLGCLQNRLLVNTIRFGGHNSPWYPPQPPSPHMGGDCFSLTDTASIEGARAFCAPSASLATI